jgi:hypothetical protein
MKLQKLALFVLLVTPLIGCHSTPTPDPDVETWELCPFYGELRFTILREDTGAPIAGATVEVPLHLHIPELRGEESVQSGPDGRLVVHQLRRGITYWGEGPTTTYTFGAPEYRERTYSVDDLVSGTSYDPYDGGALPKITYLYKEEDRVLELPVYAFTIRLVPVD